MSAHVILEDFLYEIALVSDIDDLNSMDDKLTLMSLHASKGLEFDTIYLTGMNEGLFPSYQSISSNDSEQEIEEERRLCYVGITRAKKNLYLSSARRRMLNGSYNTYSISRFVDEIDDELISKKCLKAESFFYDNSDSGYFGHRKSINYKNGNYNSRRLDRADNFIDTTSNKEVSKIDLKKSIDTYKTGENIIKATSLDYTVGDRVSHIKFGEGKVINIEDIGRDYEVTVDFDEIGTKTLFAAFAKLKKV
jgi:DNA helicase-2/ATP-dependent DNA helicase PcrA